MTIKQTPQALVPASLGSMTLLSTTTLSGASITLNSIPQTYNSLVIYIRNFKPATDDTSLKMRFNADSTANRHNYVGTGITQVNTAITFNDTSFLVSTGNDNSVASGLIYITIPDYKNTVTWKMADLVSFTTDPTTTTSFRQARYTGFYNQTTAISSLYFFASSGNLTSGEILLYGVN